MSTVGAGPLLTNRPFETVSLEPSLYVITKFLPSSVIVSTTVLVSATSVPFKLARRASVLVVEYSTFRAFLIPSKSAGDN